MASIDKLWLVILLISTRLRELYASHGKVGVDYGLNGDNLPPPSQTVTLLRSKGIRRVRMYDARQEITQAFVDSGIDLMVGVPNDLVPKIAGNLAEAINWVTQNIAQFSSGANISAVIVGNEWLLDPAHHPEMLLPAMLNIYTVLTTSFLIRNLDLSSVKVSTCFAFNVLNVSYPPSAAVFQESLLPVLRPLLNFLQRTGSFFMVNIFPYFSYIQDPNVSLDFALFEAKQPVQDPKTKLNYTNLFDMQLDAVYAALDTFAAAASMQELDGLVDKTNSSSGSDPRMILGRSRQKRGLRSVVAGESGWASGPGSSRTAPHAAAASAVLPQTSLRGRGDDHGASLASSSPAGAAADIVSDVDFALYEKSLQPASKSVTSQDHGAKWKNAGAMEIGLISDQLQEAAAAGTSGASAASYKCSGRECTAATVENARTYNQNLIRHVLQAKGTPANPTTPIRAFLFQLFNEDLKPPGPEQHFGLFFPNSTPVYPISFH